MAPSLWDVSPYYGVMRSRRERDQWKEHSADQYGIPSGGLLDPFSIAPGRPISSTARLSDVPATQIAWRLTTRKMQRAEEALRRGLLTRPKEASKEILANAGAYGVIRTPAKRYRYEPEARCRPPSLADLAKRVEASRFSSWPPSERPLHDSNVGPLFGKIMEPMPIFNFAFPSLSESQPSQPQQQAATTTTTTAKSSRRSSANVIDLESGSQGIMEAFQPASSSSSSTAPFPSFLERVPLLETERFKEAKAGTLGLLDYMLLLRKASPQLDLSGEVSYEDVVQEVAESGKPARDVIDKYISDYHAAKAAEAAAMGVPPLTPEELALADTALDRSAPRSEVMSSKFKMDITRDNLLCLLPSTWLNDEVINFWFKMLQERCDGIENGPSCYFSNSFFWNTLSGGPEKENKKYNYEGVKRWTTRAKVDIFSKDFMLFPMNIGNMHWAMGVIDFRNKGFRYYDSMLSSPHPNFVPFLRKYVSDEHKAKKGKELAGIDDWKLIPTSPPQQKNTWDCGVFTCTFADFFCSERDFNFGQENMEDLRLRIAATIVRGTF